MSPINRNTTGIALVTAILLSLLMAVMILGLLSTARGQSLLSRGEEDRAAADFAAEAGVQHAVARLRLEPDFQGVIEEKVLGGHGFYRIEFHPDPATSTVSKGFSVNNLAGLGQVNGPRGENSVPGGFADIVVVARVGLVERRVEALLSSKSLNLENTAMLATRRIRLKGDVLIDGIASWDDPEPVKAGIHSNLVDPDQVAISWNPSGAAQPAQVSGTVSVGGSSSIEMTGAELLGLPPTQTDAGDRAIPTVDIPGLVQSRSGASEVTAPASGVLVVGNGNEEDFYHNGDLELQGDLVLDKGILYVNGALKVNGSIRGEGSVFVRGSSEFFGTSSFDAGLNSKVALMSHGNINLQGFNGNKYLAQIAQNDPDFAKLYQDTQWFLKEIHQKIDASDPSTYGGSPLVETKSALRNALDGYRWKLGQLESDPNQPNPHPAASWLSEREANGFQRIAEHLATQPPSSSREHLIQTFEGLKQFFEGFNAGSDSASYLQAWKEGNGSPYGIFDVALDAGDFEAFVEVSNAVKQIHYDKLGYSQFRGLLYTNGSIYSSNEVSIVGAVVARDNGSQENVTVNGIDLEPGDIFLDNGTKLTYNAEYFEQEGGLSLGGAGVSVQAWLPAP